MPPVTSLEQQVHIQKTRMLYWDNVQSIFWTALVSLSYTGVMMVLLPHAFPLFIWLAVLASVTLLRVAFSLYVVKYLKITPKNHDALRRVFFVLLGLVSLIWGFGTLFFVPQLSLSGCVLTLMFLVCLCMGAMPYLYHDRFAVALFFIGVMLPITVWLMIQPDTLYKVSSAVALLVVLSNYLISKRLYTFMMRTLVLQIENAKLFNNLVGANKELQQKSSTDMLTKVPNRQAFEAEFKKIHSNLCRTGQCLSVVMMDIDYFKRINDTHGHLVGDQVLKRVAGVIQNQLKRPSDFVARYGGEEFVVMLPSTEAKGAVQVAQDIVDAVAQTDVSDIVGSSQSQVTLSAGVASLLATEGWCLDRYVSNADKALYQSKANGRNCVSLFSDSDVKLDALVDTPANDEVLTKGVS